MRGWICRGWIALLFVAVQSICASERQLIYTGWDNPTPATFRTDVADFEKLKSFDGAVIIATRKPANQNVERASDAFNKTHWDWSEFEPAAADLEAAKPTLCTNNFLSLTANPGNVDWFDDAGWAEVTDHWRILARVARKGGLSGIFFDPEPYRQPWAQFRYTAQPSKGEHTFAQTKAKARERGAAVMKAVAEEFPDITIFATRLFSDFLRSGDQPKPEAAWPADRFGLVPAFVDGWCDTMPATVTLIDGNEAAYNYDNTQEYAVAFARIKTEAPRFVSPENQAKIRQQFRVGQGLYMDGRVPGTKVSMNLKGATPMAHLMAFASAALDSSDGYVWVYGEKGRFWSARNSSEPPWNEKIQGSEIALRGVKQPAVFARAFLNDPNPKNNLLREVDFGEGAAAHGKVWSTWQQAGTSGTAAVGRGAARLAGMQNGTVGQMLPVKPGEMYVVAAKVKETGSGQAGLLINWQNSGKWVAQKQRVEFTPSDAPDAEGWRTITGVVTVPPGANGLAFLCFARHQAGDNAEAVFKDPLVTRIGQ
jgi:hypothetical protein